MHSRSGLEYCRDRHYNCHLLLLLLLLLLK